MEIRLVILFFVEEEMFVVPSSSMKLGPDLRMFGLKGTLHENNNNDLI